MYIELLELINTINQNDSYKNPLNTSTIFKFTSNKLAEKRILFYLIKNLILLPNQQDLVLKLTDKYLEKYNAKYDKIDYQISKIYDDNFESFKPKQIEEIKKIYEKLISIYKIKNNEKTFLFMMYLIKINFLLIKNDKSRENIINFLEVYNKNKLIMNNKKYNFFQMKISLVMNKLYNIKYSVPYYIIQNFENSGQYLNEIYLYYLYINGNHIDIIKLLRIINTEKNHNSFIYYNYCWYYWFCCKKLKKIFEPMFIEIIEKYHLSSERICLKLVEHYQTIENTEDIFSLVKKSLLTLINNHSENYKIWEFSKFYNVIDLDNSNKFFRKIKNKFKKYIILKDKVKLENLKLIILILKPNLEEILNQILNKIDN